MTVVLAASIAGRMQINGEWKWWVCFMVECIER